VDNQINFLFPGCVQDPVIIGEEINTPPAALDTGTEGVVIAQMGIGEEEDFDRSVHRSHPEYQMDAIPGL
jgi:hypothetical protein